MNDEQADGPDPGRGANRRRARQPEPSPRALEQLDRAVRAFTTLRAAHAEVLAAVHALDVENTADEFGYPSMSRLLQDHVRTDRHEITELRRHARLTRSDTTPTGAVTPPTLPATADALADAAIGPGHVRVIERAITRLSPVPDLDADVLAVVEDQLADLARQRTPRSLADAAATICEKYDPDGAAPAETSEPVDELLLTLRRDRSRLDGRFRFTDPEAIETVLTGLRRATPPVDPRAEQPAELDDPGATLPGPTLEQRQAQALRDLAADALHRPYTVDDDPGNDDPGNDDEEEPLRAEDGCSLDLTGLDAELRELLDLDAGGAGTPTPSGSPTDSRDGEFSMGRSSSGRRPTARPNRESRPRHRRRRAENKRSHRDGSRIRARAAVERGEPAHIAVTIDWELLRSRLDSTDRLLPGLGHLGSGLAVGPETARRLACDAEILPMILGSRSEPLDIGRKSRVVPPPIRRAVIVRDRHCAFPGCRRHARACDAHHLVHWASGGPTEIDNLTLLCSFHHTVVHQGGWIVRMIDGLPWFIPPRWLDPRRRPRHNRPWRSDVVPICPA